MEIRTEFLIITYIIGLPDSLGAVEIYHRQEHFHPTRTLGPKHIRLVLYNTVLLAHLFLRLRAVWVLTVII